jgi:hypothetical protein
MPYKITWLDTTVIIDFSGDVTTQEIREHGQEINDDPRFKNIRKRISNCSKIQSIETTASDIKIFGFIDKKISKIAPNAHLAIVTTNEQVKTNTEHYKQALGSGSWKVELFESISQALAWNPESG